MYGCIWVQMGLYGCVRVQGHGVTLKEDKHKQKWVGRTMVSTHVWTGNLPKIHTCAVRHKEGNGGLRSVEVSSGGRRGMHGHTTRAKQDKKSN